MKLEKGVKRRAKELNALLPRRPCALPVTGTFGKYSPMVKGNKLAAKENLTEEQHARRMGGLMQAWKNSALRNKGQMVMSYKAKKKANAAKRKTKRERVAMEFRQVQDEMRKNTPDALKTIHDILTNPVSRDADRLAAAQVILDRAYGKANQTNTNINVDANGNPTEVSDQELDARIKSTLERVESLTRGAPKAEERKEQPADLRERDRDTGGSTLH